MRPAVRIGALVFAIGIMLSAGRMLLAQTVLGQLGLTETTARNFLFSEMKTPSPNRRSEVVVAGNRAFFKLPVGTRAAAATALFAWAKAHVNSAAFKTAYANMRKGMIPEERQYTLTVDQEVQKELDDLFAGLEQMRKMAATLPPADGAKFLAAASEQEARFRDPAFQKVMRDGVAAQRQDTIDSESDLVRRVNENYPADPQRLLARRLREFLNATANVNFAAKTISLTGGADGIEFMNHEDREQSWLWQQAAIVGPEATNAARAAATAWLKEIEP